VSSLYLDGSQIWGHGSVLQLLGSRFAKPLIDVNLRLASVHDIVLIQKKIVFTAIGSWFLLNAEGIISLFLQEIFLTQNVWANNSAYMSAQGVNMAYLGTCPVLNDEVQFGQFDTPRKQATVVVCKIPQVGQRGTVCPNEESVAINIAPKIRGGPNQGKHFCFASRICSFR
jgi:hypothetical protein